MKNKIFLILLLFINICLAFGQTLSPTQASFIKNTMTSHFGPTEESRKLLLGKATFCIVGNDTLFNPYGYNYVFKLTGDSIKRLDHSIYHGGNFCRFLFSHNKILYALGGYGLFTTNNNLLFFNQISKEWVFQETNGSMPNHILGICFKNGDYIYSFNNFKCANKRGEDVYDSLFYRLDLKSMTWQKYAKPNIKFLSDLEHPYFLQDYVLAFDNKNCLIIKTSEFKSILIKNDDYGFHYETKFITINKNLLSFRPLSDTLFKTNQYSLNIDEIWQKNLANSKIIQLVPLDNIKQTSNYYTWLIIGAMLAIFLIAFFILTRIKRKSSLVDELQAPQAKQQPSLEKINLPLIDNLAETLNIEKEKPILYYHNIFINSPKNQLCIDEIDELLNILHLETDSKKQKRYRLITEINKIYPNFIERFKDNQDKRRFIYKINK